MEVFAPPRTVSFTGGHRPWYTAYHRSLIRERDRLYRRYRRSRFLSELLEYRLARDLAHQQITTARLDYYWHRLQGLTDPRLIWRELRNLGIATSPSINTADFAAEELNAYFASIAFDTDAPSLSHLLDNLGVGDGEGRFDFSSITEQDVLRAVAKTTSQAVGTDALPQVFIKSALPTIAPLLCNILNKSLTSSTFPSQWKQSVVIALNKIPTPGCLGDFRPISLLCFLSKVLERLVCDQMTAYVESEGLVDSHQAGYRTGHSTETALLKLTDDIRRARDRQQLTALVMFDFSRAFDTVDHSVLLGKLYRLGFSGRVLRWVASYLTGRSQAVREEDKTLTSFRPLNKGVPQGSVLGPLLFSLFIADIARDLNPGVHHVVYADDLQVYTHGAFADIEATLARLADNAVKVADWAERNGLLTNFAKTKAMVFGSDFYVNRFNELVINSIHLRDSLIAIVPSARRLGVVLDAKLNWKEHIREVSRRANTLMYRLYRFRRSTTLPLRKHLIESLLFPIVDYCSLVFSDLSQGQDLLLQRVLNTGIRYVYGLRKGDHVTPLRRELGWLRVSGRRDYFSACLLRRVLTRGTPSYLADFFIANTAPRPARGGEPPPLHIPRFKTDSLKNSYHVTSSRLWNSIPTDIRNTPSLHTFKRLIRDYIFTMEGEQ